MSDLETLLAQARSAWAAMTPEQRGEMIRQQRRSFVLAEARFGSDADEAAYRAAITAGDDATIARLEAEGQDRADLAARRLTEMGL